VPLCQLGDHLSRDWLGDHCGGVGGDPSPSCGGGVVAAVFDAFDDRVLLSEFPSMPAWVIAERVGWAGSASGSIRGSRCCGRNTAGTHRPDPRIDTPPAACQAFPLDVATPA
jgi:hypothetical protein